VQILGNVGIQRSFFLILTLFTFLYASGTEVEKFSYAHEVKVLVSDTEIVAGNVIRLKIRATGDKVVFPIIEEIDGVKVLEQRERITNKFHYINGVLNKERTTLILTFAPHHDMTIPSYGVEIDGKIYKSKPVKIKVVAVNAQNMEDNNKFFLHLKADKKSVIVGEPILATVYLSLKLGLRLTNTPQYTQPEFKGFFSKMVGKEKLYHEGNRQITELRYLLTPQSEGTFKIGPARVKISEADRNKRNMYGKFVGATWVPIASNTIDIEVKEKPQECDLVGSLTIKSTLDRQRTKAGKPVNLSITITGEGSLEDFELPDFEIDGVTVYSDDASIAIDLNNSTVHSTYSKKFAFISEHDFTIPARSISVYDTKSKTVKYLEIPSCDVHIEGSQTPAAQKPQAEISSAGKSQSSLKVPQKSMLDMEDDNMPQEAPSVSWWMIALAFVSGMFIMFLPKMMPKMTRGKSYHSYTESEALKILYPHIDESQEIEAMVRKLYAKRKGDKSVEINEKRLNELLEHFIPNPI